MKRSVLIVSVASSFLMGCSKVIIEPDSSPNNNITELNTETELKVVQPTNGIEGVRRFLDRVWRLALEEDGSLKTDKEALSKDIEISLHKTIKKVSQYIEGLSYNTAISALMILVNDLYKANCQSLLVIEPLIQLLHPFAPHVTEELWNRLGLEGRVQAQPWPECKEELTVDGEVTMGVQINGKMRGTISLSPEASEDEAVKKPKNFPMFKPFTEGKTLAKVIYRPGKILN